MSSNDAVEEPVKDAETFDEDATEAADETAGATDRATPSDRSRSPRLRIVAVALAVTGIVAGAVFGFIKYRGVSAELATLRAAQNDRDTVIQIARDYALKSLTYSSQDPDAFFRAVEDGVSQPLQDKYRDVADVLKQLIVDGQLTSTGEVQATDAVAQPGGVYQVVVAATQTTRNLQRPTPRASLILLQITVDNVDGTWQVSDIRRANAGGPAGPADQLPAPEPGLPAPRR